MFIRQLKYLSALARERHFARAAEACHVSQPTLSAGIRKLEEELGVALVLRGHRFEGLTAEGGRVLQWAQRMLRDYDGLRQDLSDIGEGLTGTLRIGAVPAALPSVTMLTEPFALRYPRVHIHIKAMTSLAIQRGLDDFEIDAGVTYLDNEPLSGVRASPLYRESYLLVGAGAEALGARETATWSQAASIPLCLLSADMQNRRIIDAALAEAGVAVSARIETDSFVGILAHLRSGRWASILPRAYLDLLGPTSGLSALPLIEPERSETVGLVTPDRDPAMPTVDALRRIASEAGSA